MPMYIFHLCNRDGVSPAFESFELENDAATFAKAGDLLAEHRSCDHVEIFEGDRPVVARHRDQPIIRPVAEGAIADWDPWRR